MGHTCRVCHELRLAFAEPKTIRAEHAISFLDASLMRRVAKVAPIRCSRNRNEQEEIAKSFRFADVWNADCVDDNDRKAEQLDTLEHQRVDTIRR